MATEAQVEIDSSLLEDLRCAGPGEEIEGWKVEQVNRQPYARNITNYEVIVSRKTALLSTEYRRGVVTVIESDRIHYLAEDERVPLTRVYPKTETKTVTTFVEKN